MPSQAVGRLPEVIDRRPLAKISLFIADDIVKGIRLRLGRIATRSGTVNAGLALDASLEYAAEVAADYRRYGEIDHFHGRAAELGPGDTAAVALLMRADGAEQVDLIDRYAPQRDEQQEITIYRALSARYDLDRFRTTAEWDRDRLAGITWFTGSSAETYFADARRSEKQYDFIVSRAVMEHLYDPLRAVRDMAACLRPGGKMMHKIDLRDHGMFSLSPAHDELTWLQLPRWIWRSASVNSGRSNRILAHRYRELLDPLAQRGILRYRMLITHLVQAGEISPHVDWDAVDPATRSEVTAYVEKRRRKFDREFREVPARDLAINGVFLIVEKLT